MNNKAVKENIFYAYYIVCIIVMMKMFTVWIPFWSPILELLAQVLPLLGFVLILFAKNENTNFILLLSACLLYVLGFSQWFPFDNFIYISIFILLLGNLDFNKTVKIHFWTVTIYTLILIGLTLFNIIEPVVFSSGDRIRRAFAFVHPNIFSLPMLSIFSTWLYLLIKKEFKQGLLFIVSIIFSIFLLIFYCDTKSGSICLIMLLFFYFVHLATIKSKNFGKVCMFFQRYIWVLPVLLFAFSIFYTAFYDGNNTLWAKFNDILTGRPYLQHLAYINNGLPLFGKGLSFDNGAAGSYEVIDSFYPAKIFENGIVIVSFFIFLIAIRLKKLIYNDKYNADLLPLIMTTVFFLEALSEKEPFAFMICPFLIYIINYTGKSKGAHNE